jgi:hypothetical protein
MTLQKHLYGFGTPYMLDTYKAALVRMSSLSLRMSIHITKHVEVPKVRWLSLVKSVHTAEVDGEKNPTPQLVFLYGASIQHLET